MAIVSVRQLGPAQCTRDEEGHREYRIPYQVVSNDYNDGPATVLQAPGLPVPGNYYALGNDSDPYAWCRWGPTQVKSLGENEEKFPVWRVDVPFGSKPADLKRCMDQQIGDPLLEPPKVSFSFTKYTEEATEDRFGNKILTSSHEQIRGPQNEWDNSRPQIKIEQNFPTFLALQLAQAFRDTVNTLPMWGFNPRCVKLSNVSGSREFHGFCSVYYKRVLDFDINPDTWDRDLLDEGSKALSGKWDAQTGLWVDEPIGRAPTIRAPDPANPNDFDRFFDRKFEPCRAILDGNGRPVQPAIFDVLGCLACPDGTTKKFRLCCLPTVDLSTGNPFVPNGEVFLENPLGMNCVWSDPSTTGGIPKFLQGPDPAGGQPVLNVPNNLTVAQEAARYDSRKWSFDLAAGGVINHYQPKSNDDFNCKGATTLYKTPVWTVKQVIPGNPPFTVYQDSAPTWMPDTLELRPFATEPGNIHVEKYNDTDLFLLDLPLTF